MSVYISTAQARAKCASRSWDRSFLLNIIILSSSSSSSHHHHHHHQKHHHHYHHHPLIIIIIIINNNNIINNIIITIIIINLISNINIIINIIVSINIISNINIIINIIIHDLSTPPPHTVWGLLPELLGAWTPINPSYVHVNLTHPPSDPHLITLRITVCKSRRSVPWEQKIGLKEAMKRWSWSTHSVAFNMI